MLAYTVLTLVCYFLDCVSFLLMFRFFGMEGHEKGESILLIASVFYWFMALSFIMWMGRLRYRLPHRLNVGVQNLLFGWPKTILKGSVFDRAGRN